MVDIHTGRIHYMDGAAAVALVCNNCGHIVWFNPLMMGLRPEAPQPPETTEAASAPKKTAGKKKS
jgi:hypothetical protein